MNFSDIFKKDFLAAYANVSVSILEVTAVLIVTAAIACYIFLVYRLITRKTYCYLSRYGRRTFHCSFPDGSERTAGYGIFVLIHCSWNLLRCACGRDCNCAFRIAYDTCHCAGQTADRTGAHDSGDESFGW